MLSIIVACTDKDQIIGNEGTIPWFIREDLKYFKEKTMGGIIIMGRKTFESLPGILSERKHVVVTRNKNYKIDHEDVEVLYDLNEALEKYRFTDNCFVIGGGEIYEKSMGYANKIYMTCIYEKIDGDTKFPIVSEDQWCKTYNSDIKVSEDGIVFSFIEYERGAL